MWLSQSARRALLSLFSLLVVLGGPFCCAQELQLLPPTGPGAAAPAAGVAPVAPVAPVAEPPLSPERVETLRKEAEQSADLDEETRKKIAEIYRAALAELQRATELDARAAAFKKDAEQIEQRVAETKQQLDELKGKEPEKAEGETVAELEQSRAKLELQLAALKKQQAAAEAEPKARAQRRKEIRARLAEVPARLAECKKQSESAPADEPAHLATARRTELAARRMALEREVPALEHELTKYDAEDAADLVRLQRDLCTQNVALAERQLRSLEGRIKSKRTIEADKAVRQARDEAIAADPVLKSHAEHNRELTELTQSLTEKYDGVERELKAAKEVHEHLLRQFKQTREKVDSVGLTSSIGALLRKQRAALPDVRKRRAAVHTRQDTINEAQYELFEYDDERQELANPELLVRRIVTHAGSRDPEMLKAAAHDVLERKREYLDAVLRGYNKYFDALVELDTTEQQIISLARQYQQYIDERVLWIRSGNLLVSEMRLDQSDVWLVNGHRWAEAPRRLWIDMRRHGVYWGLALVLFAILVKRGRRCRLELREIGEAVQRTTCYEFGPSLRAVLLTLAIAVLWPGLVAFVAWRLHWSSNGSQLAKAVGQGLLCMCAVWFPLELFRQICRTQGLGEAHFAWPSSATQLLRRNLRWLLVLGLPLTFVTSTMFASDPTHGRDAVERVCFIVLCVVLAAFLRRVLRPSGGVFGEYIRHHQGAWIDRLKQVWYWVGVSAPLLIAGLALWGYYYTAQVLSWRLFATMCFAAALVLVRALLLRLILLRRRKLSIEQARERAAAAAQASEPSATPGNLIPEQPKADLSAHSVQTQRLLATGMLATTLVGFWLIWVDVLPALSMLDRWPLWTTTAVVQVAEEPAEALTPLPALPGAESEAAPAPAAATRIDYRTTTINFSHLALALLIAVITVTSARNVPGMLEMFVLQRLPLDASVRYAITTLVSYGIVLLGVVVACSEIGLRWSQIQWLATALTFGLAFGLQEIFANFVAGLIILFERPVRVGDIVTVDNVTGIVSRIRIRATSITNWDRQEYVVPNKEFITGRLLNWTLSDKVNRICINVGVAYGSDTERARQLLLKVANDHPLILKEPPSLATFEGFGDSSLNLVLRTYLPNLENRLQVIHELHSSIDKAFREANLEIAFPQRDLHIRTTPQALATALQEDEEAEQQEAA